MNKQMAVLKRKMFDGTWLTIHAGSVESCWDMFYARREAGDIHNLKIEAI